MEKPLTDFEKQKLLAALYLHKVYAPGLDLLAFRVVESISAPAERESAWLTLSYYLAAFSNFGLAEEVASQYLRGYAKASGLAAIGCELAKDDPARAVAYLQAVEPLLTGVVESDERAILLRQISKGYSQARSWQRAKELADLISPTEDRVSSLCEIAGSLWRANELEAAKQMLAEARELANQTPASERTSALSDVARVYLEMNQIADATEILGTAAAFADKSLESSKWLFSICQRLVSVGRSQQAREVALQIKNQTLQREALSLIGET